MGRLARLVVRDFRNLEHVVVDVPADGLALVGDNGHGKSNLLEGIAYFHALRSVRGARDQDLVRFGRPAFHLTGSLAEGSVSNVGVGFERASRRKRVTLDGANVQRLSDAVGMLPSVTIAPRDSELVTGAPSERRRYLDVLLALSVPGYLGALQSYRSALARRNATLRALPRPADLDLRVSLWEGALASSGARLIAARLAWLQQVGDRYAELCVALGERETPSVRYRATADGIPVSEGDRSALEAMLAAAYATQRPGDIRRGATMAGPHRDDLDLRLGGRLLRTFGSAGQHRCAALVLRLLEAESLRHGSGRDPLLLLDDPFAELDSTRSMRVLELLRDQSTSQVIVAVPRIHDIPSMYSSLSRFAVRDGTIAPLVVHA